MIAVVAVFVGLVAGYLLASRLGARTEQARREELADRLTNAQATLAQRDAALQESGQQAARLQAQLEEREKSAQSQLEEREKRLQMQIDERDKSLQTAADLEKKMQQAFAELSQSALSRTSEDFLRLASQRFESLSKETQGQLATREEAIKGLVAPLDVALKQYKTAVEDLDRRRQEDASTLEERLKTMAEAEAALRQQTDRLANALRRPEVRGHWGEMQLRNAVELAGMSEHCDFVEQEHLSGEDINLRPDMVIHLPGERCLVVDAKVPWQAYQDALQCDDPDQRAALLQEHARQCRNHLDNLASKQYWKHLPNSPDCVIMFIHGESLFAAAVEADEDLIARGLKNRVIIATPSTLIAMLYAVHYGWQQQVFAENAEAVGKLAGEMYDRLATFVDPFQKLGRSLNQSVNSFNTAVSSLQSRVIVSARKLKEMGVSTKKELPEVEPVDSVARQMPALSPAEDEAESALPPEANDT